MQRDIGRGERGRRGEGEKRRKAERWGGGSANVYLVAPATQREVYLSTVNAHCTAQSLVTLWKGYV